MRIRFFRRDFLLYTVSRQWRQFPVTQGVHGWGPVTLPAHIRVWRRQQSIIQLTLSLHPTMTLPVECLSSRHRAHDSSLVAVTCHTQREGLQVTFATLRDSCRRGCGTRIIQYCFISTQFSFCRKHVCSVYIYSDSPGTWAWGLGGCHQWK